MILNLTNKEWVFDHLSNILEVHVGIAGHLDDLRGLFLAQWSMLVNLVLQRRSENCKFLLVIHFSQSKSQLTCKNSSGK